MLCVRSIDSTKTLTNVSFCFARACAEQRAPRSPSSSSPVRTASSTTSIIPPAPENTPCPSPGGARTSRRGELRTRTVCACVFVCLCLSLSLGMTSVHYLIWFEWLYPPGSEKLWFGLALCLPECLDRPGFCFYIFISVVFLVSLILLDDTWMSWMHY